MQKTKRINARVTPQVYKKLEELSKALGTSISEALMISVDGYCNQQNQNLKLAKDLLKNTGFIGCAKGPSTLSQNYKRLLSDTLRKKL